MKEGNIVKEPKRTVYNLIWMRTAGKPMAWEARLEERGTGENGISFTSLEHSLQKQNLKFQLKTLADLKSHHENCWQYLYSPWMIQHKVYSGYWSRKHREMWK